MFMLFLLSHGSMKGMVSTDHPLVAGANKSKLVSKEIESYLLSDIWDGLKKMPFVNDCLILLMLGVSCFYVIDSNKMCELVFVLRCRFRLYHRHTIIFIVQIITYTPVK